MCVEGGGGRLSVQKTVGGWGDGGELWARMFVRARVCEWIGGGVGACQFVVRRCTGIRERVRVCVRARVCAGV